MDEKRLIEAHQLHQQGQLTDALACYQSLASDHPDEADLLHIMAIIQAELQQHDQAIKTINQAIKKDPKDQRYYNSKANILMRQQHIEEAITALKQALKIQPNYSIAHNTLGRCYYQKNDHSKALSHYKKALAIDPDFVDAQYNYALSLVCTEALEEAISQLKKVIEQAPHHVKAYGLLGEAYLAISQYKLASEAYLKRIDLQPQHANSYYSLGITALHQNDPAEAERALQQAIALECKQDDLYHLLANAYLQQSDHAKALSYYMRQLEISPMIETYYNIGIILMYQDRNKEALDYLHQAETLSPNDLPVQINLGTLYLKLKNYQKAIEHYKKALTIEPDNEEIQHILAAINSDETSSPPDKAPDQYIENLFNQYSLYYDKHLQDVLQYRVPSILHEQCQSVFFEDNVTPEDWRIIDLGCGTGLSAPPFKPWARELIGIDLAADMVAIAQHKNIYDHLIVKEAEAALKDFHKINLIVACDVFSYFGELTSILKACQHALIPGGYLGFSVEKTLTPPFILQKNIRYAHHEEHIKQCIADAQLTLVSFETVTLRTQQKKPVTGFCVIARRS